MPFFSKTWINGASEPMTVLKGAGSDDCRYYYNLNGTDEAIEIAQRLVASPVADSFSIAFSLRSPIGSGALVSQNFTTAIATREFSIYTTGGNFSFVIGGTATNTGVPVSEGDWIFEFGPTNYSIFLNNVSVDAGLLNRGATVEIPSTLTIGAAHADSLSAYTDFYNGIIFNVGVVDATSTVIHTYPIDDNDSVIKDTTGSADGAIVGGTLSGWQFICEEPPSDGWTADNSNITADSTTNTADQT